jgi:thiol-disulfide isomerase/thioredoxin
MRLLKRIVLDLIAGFCALAVCVATATAIHNISHFTLFLLFATALFLVAGLIRAIGSQSNPWLQGIVVSLGAAVPAFLVGRAVMALTANGVFWGFVLLVTIACGAGAQTQKLWHGPHRPRSIVLLLSFGAFVFLAGKFIIPRLLNNASEETMSKPAPEFHLTMLDGAPVASESLRGRVIVLDFWGTWCAACVAEMPVLAQTYKQYLGNKDVVFLAVNSEEADDTPDKIRTFVTTKHLDIPVALDTAGMAKNMGVGALPSQILIDKGGNIRWKGNVSESELQNKLTEHVDALLQGD